MTMQHVIEAAADAAFERYVEALAASAIIPAAQHDLFEARRDEAIEWRGIYIACELAAVRA
ncbi:MULTISPECIES: hypothetical protein [Luteimonas]|uniref:hypothetical protein n=1 Tax=Luteimonas TaxID=83614 RepID=UPI000C7C1269|nr:MULTISPECIES: hypothetical protein [Luteimonas]